MLIRYGKEKDGKLIKKAVVYTSDEHKINAADLDREAVFITSRLRANGHESYIVGGAVRDLILGKKPKDFDIVTSATPARIKRIFRNSRIIGRRFRLVHVYFGPRIFEVSTFRSLKDGHSSNTYGTIEDDVLRRDFSCNALLYDPGKQLVVDYVNGMNDIKKGILRPIIPSELIFKDDPVRMIRAVKYAVVGSLSIPWRLKRRIKKEAELLNQVSPSRLTEELSKIIRSPAASQIVEELEKTGLYVYLQKEASALMKNNSAFRAAYLAGFNQSIFPLSALVRDYLELTIPSSKQSLNKPLQLSWKELEKGSFEDYRAVFQDVRRFILPMNPPRAELEQALRIIFTEHGIDVKKSRFFERVRTRKRTKKVPQ